MPRHEHLDWVEITDFSKGLWTANDWLMPADGFQTMEDCFPQNSGGLRAFWKPTATTVSNLTTTDRVIWMDSFTTTGATTFLLLTVVPSTGQLKAWIRDASASSWTLSKSFTAPASAAASSQATACQYIKSDGTRYFAVGVGDPNGSGDSGVWLYDIVGASWSQIGTSSKDVVLCTYQSRLLTRDDSTSIGNNRISWTDPGGITFPAANFLDLSVQFADAGNQIAVMIPYSPSVLLVGTVFGGWYAIEGDINDPVVRAMGSEHSPNLGHGFKAASTDAGVIFPDPKSGLYITQNMAGAFERLDPQLAPYNPPAVRAGYGVTAYKDFLFAPNGRVMDRGSGAWFTLSEGVGSTPCDFTHAVTYESGGYNSFSSAPGIYAPQFCDSFKINYYSIDQAVSDGRYETYTVKTAPLRNPDGRQIAIREVQVALKSYNADATCAVTVNGTTRTSAALGTGLNVVSFLFAERGEYLDVQVVPDSNDEGTEAPSLEGIKIGTRSDGHQLH